MERPGEEREVITKCILCGSLFALQNAGDITLCNGKVTGWSQGRHQVKIRGLKTLNKPSELAKKEKEIEKKYKS